MTDVAARDQGNVPIPQKLIKRSQSFPHSRVCPLGHVARDALTLQEPNIGEWL